MNVKIFPTPFFDGSEVLTYCKMVGKKFALQFSKMYSEWSQTSKMELFAKLVHGFQLLTIFSKSSILGV